jgi:hypothetical protein
VDREERCWESYTFSDINQLIHTHTLSLLARSLTHSFTLSLSLYCLDLNLLLQCWWLDCSWMVMGFLLWTVWH